MGTELLKKEKLIRAHTKRMKLHIYKVYLICLILFVGHINVTASEHEFSYKVLPDSSNFVQASVVIATPGKELFFILGHSALRLKCPSEDLDYCFSFDTIVDQGANFNFLLMMGQMKAGYEAVPFTDYIKPFRESGRGVYEYPLNLTLEEERELWKLMDTKMLKGATFKFDFLFNNCTAPLFRSLESIMINERFEYTNEYPLMLNTRERMRVSLNSSWFDFLSVIMLSCYYNKDNFPLYMKIYPELWGRLLIKARIIDKNGSSRPALEGPVKELLPQQLCINQTRLTPILVFGCFLAFVLLITLLGISKGFQKLTNIVDNGLFVIYILFSIYLLYASFIQLFGIFTNWFLVVFNPLPLVVWVLFRKKPFYLMFWAFYILILSAFMIFLPFYMGTIEWPHEFLLATLLTRSIANYRDLRSTCRDNKK